MNTTFRLTIVDSIGSLLLEPGQPGRPPTFDHASLDAFDVVLGEIDVAITAGTLRTLFIRSASPRFFCAGANIGALETLDTKTIAAWVEHGHRVFNRLAGLPVPTVARVEGYALGGGLELALACDLIFAADTAQLGQTEAGLGFVAGWGGSYRLPRRVGINRASDLFFSARIVPAPEAAGLGLVDFCGAAAALDEQCAGFARAVLAGSSVSHREHKRLLALASDANLTDVAQAEATASAKCLEAADTIARVQAFLHRRKKPSHNP